MFTPGGRLGVAAGAGGRCTICGFTSCDVSAEIWW